MNDLSPESKETPTAVNCELTLKIKELQTLCAELDPFKKISKKHKKILKKYGLSEVKDPYLLSNHLISLTEDALTEQSHQMNKLITKDNDGINILSPH